MSITEGEIELLREQQEKFMPNLITIRRVGYVAEGEIAPDNVATKVPARIKSGFGFFREVAEKLPGITAYTITTPWDTDLRVGDKVIDENSGEIFEIRDVRDHNSYQTAVQVLGDRIK